MGKDTELFPAVREALAGVKRILISGHVNPDGDSMGSMIALARMLTQAGYQAFGTVNPLTLGKIAFLEGAKDLIPLNRLKRQKSFDLLIAVDCGDYSRMPPEIEAKMQGQPVICIDHHITNDASNGFAKVAVVDPTAASTGEIIWRFARWSEWPIDQVTAEALWVSLVTDTGRFAYSNTTTKTLRAAGDLLKRGVRTAEINDQIFGSFSSKSMALKRLAWRSLHIWKNRKVAEVTLTRDDYRSVRGKKADAEDVIEIPRSVARNEIAIFFHQIPDRTKEVRCSIRTRPPWDATVLAKQFGGGGHIRAAGCTIRSSMGGAKRQMRAAIKEMLKG